RAARSAAFSTASRRQTCSSSTTRSLLDTSGGAASARATKMRCCCRSRHSFHVSREGSAALHPFHDAISVLLLHSDMAQQNTLQQAGTDRHYLRYAWH